MSKTTSILLLFGLLVITNLSISYAFETSVLNKNQASEEKVLAYQHVKYSDPVVDSSYTANAQFQPKGMEHVYTITHAFLDLVQRKDVLPSSINATQILNDDFWEAKQSTKAASLQKVKQLGQIM